MEESRLVATHAHQGSRRTVVGAALGMAATGLVAMTRSTAAIRGWCRSDPLISIDGELADIFCTAPPEILLSVTDPTEIVVTVPRTVKAQLVLIGPGFGKGERVRFETSRKLKQTRTGIEVVVAVMVPARDDLPIHVEFAARILGILNPDRVEGATNRWVKLKTVF